MGFDFSKLKNVNILKNKEVPTIEEEMEPSIEEIFSIKEEVKEEPINSKEDVKEEEVEEELHSSPASEEVDNKIEEKTEEISKTSEDTKEDNCETNINSNQTKGEGISLYESTDFLGKMKTKLGLEDNTDLNVYRPSVLKDTPLNFKEIRDTKGKIKDKVMEIELRTRLSCIPFSLAGLNPNIVEIKDYVITKVGNEKYISSDSRIVNKDRVTKYQEKWSDMILCAEEIREDLMVEEIVDGEKIRTIAFNKAELDLLLSLFNQVNATLVIYKDKIEFIAGV